MCALFFSVPLYVIVVTSLKSMDQIRQGDIFALPWSLNFDAWVTAWTKPARARAATASRPAS